MKRAIIFIMTLVISLSCCVPAFAEIDINEIDGTKEFVEEIQQDEALMSEIIEFANSDNSLYNDDDIKFTAENTVIVDSNIYYLLDSSTYLTNYVNKDNVKQIIEADKPNVYHLTLTNGNGIYEHININKNEEKYTITNHYEELNLYYSKNGKDALRKALEEEELKPVKIYYVIDIAYVDSAFCFFEDRDPIVFVIKKADNNTDERIAVKYDYEEFKQYATNRTGGETVNFRYYSAIIIIAIATVITFVILFAIKKKSKVK